jgi:carboxyl-terminal processing protease
MIERGRAYGAAVTRSSVFAVFAALALAACPKASTKPDIDAPPDPALLQSFDYAWSRVAEVHPYPDMRGLDWDAVRERHRPVAEAARTPAQVRVAIQGMLGELGESHYAVFPPSRAEPSEVSGTVPSKAPAEGDKQAEEDKPDGPAAASEVGVEVRLVGADVLITQVLPGTSAEEQGLRPGWRLTRVGSLDVSAMIEALPERMRGASGYPLFVAHTVSSALSGPRGTTIDVVAGPDGDPREVTLDRRPVGVTASFGNFPPISVRFDSDLLADGRVGYIGFSVFMPVVASAFQDAMRSHRDAGVEGLVIDLRGNPGGLAGMVMGLSGWLVGERGAALGVMKMRDAELRFVVNPRASKDRFDGPIVVLVDGLSASTSELFAAGLQELGRVTVVGTTSAGMSLPSIIETLPDGDLLQFVTADLHTPGGARLEGVGVVPDVVVPWDEASLLAGTDPQLDAALSHLLTTLETP